MEKTNHVQGCLAEPVLLSHELFWFSVVIIHILISDANDTKRDHQPFFRCNAVLAIPNIVMQPALDEVQQAVNKAAQNVLNVAKVQIVIGLIKKQ